MTKKKLIGTKAERSAKELRSGLRNEVEDYLLCRHYGNVSGAKECQKIINKAIREKGLDKDLVYGTKAYRKMKVMKGKDVRMVCTNGVWKVVERR
jgi:hypothetical protein